MRKLLIFAAAFAALPSLASAQFAPIQPFQPFQGYSPPAHQAPQPSTNYDWRSGNVTTTTPNYGGGANVNGYNTNTGSTWRTQVQPNGNASGTDSRGNYWTYNRASGSYINSDGTVCVGQGAGRTCN